MAPSPAGDAEQYRRRERALETLCEAQPTRDATQSKRAAPEPAQSAFGPIELGELTRHWAEKGSVDANQTAFVADGGEQRGAEDRQQLNRFGSVSMALAAYNAGPGAVRRSRGIPRNGETPAYVSKVLRRWLEWRGTKELAS